MAYARDRWYWPVTVTASTNQMVITEDPAGVPLTETISITAGTYWLHDDSTLHSNGYPSLYRAIRAAISTLNNTYATDSVTPTISTAQTNAGLRWTRTAGTDDFRLDFQDAAFTMDNRWFGWPTAQTSVTDTSGNVDSPYTVRGWWSSWTLTDGAASDKRSHQVRALFESSSRVADAYQVEWNTDTIRTMVYEYVPAAHVHVGRGGDAGYAATGSISSSDENNTFELVWETASRLGEVVIVHNDVSDTAVVTHDYDIVRLASLEQRRDFSQCYSMVRSNGELYTIDVSLYLVTQGYDH